MERAAILAQPGIVATRRQNAAVVAAGVLAIALSFAGCNDDLQSAGPHAQQTPITKLPAGNVLIEIRDEPLDAALLRLAKQHGFSLKLHPQATAEWTTGPPRAFCRLRMPLEKGLQVLLDLYGLEPSIQPGTIEIVPKGMAAMPMVTRVYSLTGLVGRAGGPFDEQAFRDLVVKLVQPESWAEEAGHAFIRAAPGGLVITQTKAAHAQIARLLADLRSVADGDPPKSGPIQAPMNDQMRTALEAQVPVAVIGMPVKKLAEYISNRHRLNVALENSVLDVDPEATPTYSAGGVRLDDALTTALQSQGLTWRCYRETIVITPAPFMQRAWQQRWIRVYSLADLMDPKSDFGLSELKSLLQTEVQVTTWDDVFVIGGWAHMAVIPGGLAVLQDREGHREMERVLQWLKTCQDPFRPAPIGERVAIESRVGGLLERNVSIRWARRPLLPAVLSLLRAQGIEDADVEAVGAEASTAVTLTVQGVPLRSALDRILHKQGLRWHIEGRKVVLTTAERDHETTSDRYFRVAGHTGMAPWADLDAFENELVTTTIPRLWFDSGGLGSTQRVPGGMVVTQRPEGHGDVKRFLEQWARLGDADAPDVLLEHPSDSARRIRESITKTVTVDIHQEGLLQAIRELAAAHGLGDCSFAHFSVSERPKPISLHVRDVTLASAFDLLLSRDNLSWEIDEGQFSITGPTRAGEVWLYHLPRQQRNEFVERSKLRRALRLCIAPESYAEFGGIGSIDLLPGGMSVAQSRPVQAEIRGVLEQLRPVLADPDAALGRRGRSVAEQRLDAALARPASIHSTGSSLSRVLRNLGRQAQINILFDHVARLPGAITTSPVSLSMSDLPLRELLDRLLLPRGLDWIERDEVLLVTTRSAAAARLEPRLHDLRPFLEPRGPFSKSDLSHVLALFAGSPRRIGSKESSWPVVRGVALVTAHRRAHLVLDSVFAQARQRLPRVDAGRRSIE